MRLRLYLVDDVISTDDIIPGRYKHMFTDPRQLAEHVFENRFPGLATRLSPGSAIWSSALFGIGSSREQAATSLKAAGVEVVLAPRFGRIFYRNAWNVGLRLVALDRPSGLRDEDEIEIDWKVGELKGPQGSQCFETPPDRIREIVAAGGLLNWVKQREMTRHV